MKKIIRALTPYGLKSFDGESESEENLKKAREIFATDPYGLPLLLDIDFRIVDAYVLDRTGIDRFCPARISAAIRYVLHACEHGLSNSEAARDNRFDEMVALAAGSTCILKSRIFDYVEALLGIEEGSIDMPLLDKCIKHLFITGKISVNRMNSRVYLANKETYRHELTAAEHVCSKLDAPKPRRKLKQMYKAVDSAMASTGKILSQEQKNAVSMILQNKISVLTGGPGTGKTQTELVLIKALKILEPNATVRCIAPTGQAARRMTDATGCPATTIHKALDIIPGVGRRTNKLLSESLIICDEASMIDAEIFSILMESLSDNSTVVFVGDVAQLPSVGAGNVLSELIDSDSVPVTRLTKIFRQGDNSIAFNCAKIQAGNPKLDQDASFQFIERKSSDQILKEVVECYRKEIKANGPDSVVVLTPYRRSTTTGVNNLNIRLREVLHSTASLPYCEAESGMRIYEGDKVTYLRNKNGLVNGETGTAVRCSDGKVECRFGEKKITLKGTALSDVEPAFAQTVHKSQGLEYPVCIIVIDQKHSNMLTREIIYTAISRSKKRCICIGQEKLLKAAVLAGEGSDLSELSASRNVRSSCLSMLIDSKAGTIKEEAIEYA